MLPDRLNGCMPSTTKRSLEHHLEDSERWAQNLSPGDPMQMIGWRPTAYVLARRVRELDLIIETEESEIKARDELVKELEAERDGRQVLPYCPRCCRIAPASVHTCTPTQEWRAMETERDRYRAALREMSDELSHYPEGDGIFGHLKRILRRALT